MLLLIFITIIINIIIIVIFIIITIIYIIINTNNINKTRILIISICNSTTITSCNNNTTNSYRNNMNIVIVPCERDSGNKQQPRRSRKARRCLKLTPLPRDSYRSSPK